MDAAKSSPRRPRTSRWRRAWGIYMGRARSASGRVVAEDRGDFRNFGRSDERRRDGAWLYSRRRGWRLARHWKPSGARCRMRPASVRSSAARSIVLLGRWTLDHSPLFVGHGHDGACVLALRPQSWRHQSAPRHSGGDASISSGWHDCPIKLFVTATNVRTGRGRVFRNGELSPDVLLASACLPTLFQAIEIDGIPIGTAAIAGNPTITPLVRECESQDTILVQINPDRTARARRASARDILNRLNEVSFNAVLLKELKMIALLRKVARSLGWGGRPLGGHADPPHLQRNDDRSRLLRPSSTPNGNSLTMLRDEGRKAADEPSFTPIADDLGKPLDSSISMSSWKGC